MRAGLGKTAAALALGLMAAMACGACGSSSSTAVDPSDAASDAQPEPDGPIPEQDAGPDVADARQDVIAPPGGYCASLVPKPKFCDDFDDGDLTNDWDQPTAVGGSLMALDEASYTSPPASFVVQTQNLTVATSGNALLRKTVFGAVAHVKLSFSMLTPTVTFTKGIISIATLDVSTNHFFTLSLRDQDAVPAASLEEYVGATMTRHVLTRLPPAGVWTRITIDLDFTAGKANVTFDALKALDAEPIMPVPGTEATIRVGGVYIEGPADPFKASFDDVVVDF